MPKHHLVIREQGRCSCGMRSHNSKKLSTHAKARGHAVTKYGKNRGAKPT